MTQKEVDVLVNFTKNIMSINCVTCAFVFAFTQPLKSIAFTLLGTLFALSNMQINTTTNQGEL
jgi:hypothetical protein